FDCVFLCDVPFFGAAEVKRLEAHVRRGGAVVFSLGNNVKDLAAYNDALYRGGAGLLPAKLMKKQDATDGYQYQFAIHPQADREPPLKVFQEAGARQKLLDCRFRQFIQTEVAAKAGVRKVLGFAPVAPPGRDGTGLVRATAPPGGPALLEWNPPAGKDSPRA